MLTHAWARGPRGSRGRQGWKKPLSICPSSPQPLTLWWDAALCQIGESEPYSQNVSFLH